MSWGWGWRPYVPVAQRRAKAKQLAKKMAKKGQELCPIELEGRTIAKSFWGKAWCDNLESYSDFENRLPRGRTYIRNGSVVDLKIERGLVTALVSGSELYKVKVNISTLPKTAWQKIKHDCSRSIDSLLDLLMGHFSDVVMERFTHQKEGLFPRPSEIKMQCSCPDWATLCKHVAATLYGVGARLDAKPELLFTLRDVDHADLIQQAVTADNVDQALTGKAGATLSGDNLGEIFGIDLDQASAPAATAPPPAPAAQQRRGKSKTPAVDQGKTELARAPKAMKTKSRRALAQRKPGRKKVRGLAPAGSEA